MIKTFGIIGALAAQSVLPAVQPIQDEAISSWELEHSKTMDGWISKVANPMSKVVYTDSNYEVKIVGYESERAVVSLFNKLHKRYWVYKTNLYQSQVNGGLLKDKIVNLIKEIDDSIIHKQIEMKNMEFMSKFTDFNQKDDVEFKSSWGVKNSDTGRSTWTTSIDNDVIKASAAGLLKQAFNSQGVGIDIDNAQTTLTGLQAAPLTSVKNPPVEHPSVKYSLTIDDKLYDSDSLALHLPKGSDSGVEWWHGFIQGIGIGALVVPVVGEALEFGGAAAEAVAETAGIFSGAVGGAEGFAGLALSGQTELLGQIATTTLNSIQAGLDAIDLAGLSEIGGLLALGTDAAKRKALEKIDQYTTDSIKSEIQKSVIKDIKDLIDKTVSKINMELEVDSSSASSSDSYANIPLNIFNYSGDVKLDSILYGDAKATSLFGDKTEFEHSGDFVKLDYNIDAATTIYTNIDNA